MRQVLALIVGGSAGKERPPLNPRFERGRLPEFERLRWLNIVVSVNKEMRLPPPRTESWRLGHYDRIAFRRAKPSLQTDPTAVVYQPICAGHHIFCMVGLG